MVYVFIYLFIISPSREFNSESISLSINFPNTLPPLLQITSSSDLLLGLPSGFLLTGFLPKLIMHLSCHSRVLRALPISLFLIL
jgi:hypothetical protein